MEFKVHWGPIWGDEACPSAIMTGEWFHKCKVFHVLVPGCGYGRNSEWLAKQGFHITAFDVSVTAIQLAIERSRKAKLDIQYMVGDVFDDSFLDDK